MNEVNFSTWTIEVDKNVKELYRVTDQIQNIGKRLKTNDITYDTFLLCQSLNR